MITENYVSFEIAKLLKEKGFNSKCIAYYLVFDETIKFYECNNLGQSLPYISNDNWGIILKNPLESGYAAPTLQMAMKWLREEYNFFIEIQCYGCEANEKAHFEFSYVISEYVQFDNKICITVGLEEKKAKSQFKSYEEAVEAAIKYCLENLI